MKKRLLALMICVCILATGCDKLFASKKNYDEVIIGGVSYYQVKDYMKENSYSYFDFNGKWLEELSSVDLEDERRYISVNDSLNLIIDIKSDEFISFNHGKVLDYKNYKKLCEKFSMNQDYDDSSKNYIVVMESRPSQAIEFHPVNIIYDKDNDIIDYYYYEDWKPAKGDNHSFICVIPTECDVDTEIVMKVCYDEAGIDDWKDWYEMYPEGTIEYKPVIYLYPENDNSKVDVSFELSDAELTCTYPLYKDGWSVIANKDGLIELNDMEYNYLYWEGKYYNSYSIEQGFCVKGCDTAAFLEEKLAELGLNRREANEFIVYWLPLMEGNEYNVISFNNEQYEVAFKLNVNPTPDTLIRVFMTWYGVDEEVEITLQNIETPDRNGFTVVEWGGSRIK